MNKYQEALNGIIECYEELESRVGNDPNKVKEFNSIKTLQEFVGKATPKKVNLYNYDKNVGKCPICNITVYSFMNIYCQICGQALDWSDK